MPCFWEMQLQIARRLITWLQGCHGLRWAVSCYWGMQLQIARHLITVASRRSWVASGGAVLLGNGSAEC